MIKNRLFFIFIIPVLLICSIPLYGDTVNSEDKKFIIRYSPLIFEDVNFFLDPSYDANKKNEKDGIGKIDDGITYYPNNPAKYAFDILYQGIGLGFTFNYSTDKEEIIQKGKTKYSDYRIFFYSRIFGLEANYQNYKGFYIYEPEKIYNDWDKTDPNPQRPDLSVKNIGINLYYVFSPDDFSFPAAINQSDMQTEWGGSFILMLSYNYLKVESSYDLIPDEIKIYYRDDAGFEGGTFQSFCFSAGYSYSFTLFNFFFTPMLIIGMGPQYFNYANDFEYISKWDFGLSKFNIRGTLGYNGPNFTISTTMSMDTATYETNNLRLNSMISHWDLSAGLKI